MAQPAQPAVPEEEAPNRHLAVLKAAARALHGETELDRVLEWAVEASAELAGTEWAAAWVLSRSRSPIWTIPPGSRRAFGLVGDPRTVKMLAPAFKDGELLCIEDLHEAERNLPSLDRMSGSLRARSVLVAPVVGTGNVVHGALFAASPHPGPFEPDAIDAVSALAAHLGVALDNHATLAHMAEVEARGKEVVYRLQEAVRPPAPVVPFTELGVHYVAADPSAPTGGDLYDWVMLPDGDLHLVVVDVMGKGVEATKHALVIIHALRLLAVEGCELERMVSRADGLVTAQSPDLVATLLVARYRPDSGRLLLAGAGHPPALLVSPQGAVREIAAPGIPIGWPGAGSHRVVELALERSDTLILYTDGLIEATKDIVKGLEDLARSAAATASYPAPSMARALVDRQLADAARHDDSVAVALRRRIPPPPARSRLLGPLVHRFSPTPAAVPVARHFLLDWLERVPLDASTIDELLVVASELCANAVRHATGAPGGIVLRAWTENDAVVIEAEDDGGAVLPYQLTDELPDPEAEEGRGLFLVQMLTDELESRTEEGRTVVRVVKRAVVGSDVAAELDRSG